MKSKEGDIPVSKFGNKKMPPVPVIVKVGSLRTVTVYPGPWGVIVKMPGHGSLHEKRVP